MTHAKTYILGAALLFIAAASPAATLELSPLKDNTLYEVMADTVALSNGAGSYMFVGNTNDAEARRAVVAFDLTTIPPQSTINTVTLQLYMSRTAIPDIGVTTTLHRLLADWGEGASDAPGNEGGGVAAEAGDATWLDAFFPGNPWASPGGDFVATASAAQLVSGIGSYTWSDPDLIADVQIWVDDPASNHGWVVVGFEDMVPSAKRFGSRENGDPSQRPLLIVDYDTAVPSEPATWGNVKALYR